MGLLDFLASLGPRREVDLVKKITEKTKAGRIAWSKTPNGISATVFGVLSASSLKMNFVETPLSAVSSPLGRWVIFSVRQEPSTEILKVQNSAGLIPPITIDPLHAAVDELYGVIRANAKNDIDRAIDLLDNA